MAANKVIYGGTVLVDLTADTVTAEHIVSGKTAHDKSGAAITGTLTVQKYYTGSTDPSASLGADGDLYLKVVG